MASVDLCGSVKRASVLLLSLIWVHADWALSVHNSTEPGRYCTRVRRVRVYRKMYGSGGPRIAATWTRTVWDELCMFGETKCCEPSVGCCVEQDPNAAWIFPWHIIALVIFVSSFLLLCAVCWYKKKRGQRFTPGIMFAPPPPPPPPPPAALRSGRMPRGAAGLRYFPPSPPPPPPPPGPMYPGLAPPPPPYSPYPKYYPDPPPPPFPGQPAAAYSIQPPPPPPPGVHGYPSGPRETPDSPPPPSGPPLASSGNPPPSSG